MPSQLIVEAEKKAKIKDASAEVQTSMTPSEPNKQTEPFVYEATAVDAKQISASKTPHQKLVSNQEVGVFLQSSGKSSMMQLNPGNKHVWLTSQGQNGSTQNHSVLPQSSVSHSTPHTVLTQAPSTTSSQTLRSLLSSNPENLPIFPTILLPP